jgi:hypothetical protein
MRRRVGCYAVLRFWDGKFGVDVDAQLAAKKAITIEDK